MTHHPTTVLATERAAEAAQALADLTGQATHDVAVVLGSGWVPAADLLGTTTADFLAGSTVTGITAKAGGSVHATAGNDINRQYEPRTQG